jgi:hypothetical protein
MNDDDLDVLIVIESVALALVVFAALALGYL